MTDNFIIEEFQSYKVFLYSGLGEDMASIQVVKPY